MDGMCKEVNWLALIGPKFPRLGENISKYPVYISFQVRLKFLAMLVWLFKSQHISLFYKSLYYKLI